MMAAFMAIVGVFAIYSAITGKGPAFNNDYPKAMKEDANKMLRKFCWYIGPITLVNRITSYNVCYTKLLRFWHSPAFTLAQDASLTLSQREPANLFAEMGCFVSYVTASGAAKE